MKVISTKGLTADLINEYSILNEAKYFSSNGLQKYIVFITTRHIEFISDGGRYSKIKSWGSAGM